MLKELSGYPKELSLVCNSGVQFIDYGLNIKDGTINLKFCEQSEKQQDSVTYTLRGVMEEPDTGRLVDEETAAPIDEDSVYSINLIKAP